MRLWSDSFRDGAPLPVEYAFGRPAAGVRVALSDNRNPHLAWDDVPDGTQSFALIVHDYDVPSRPDDVNREGRKIPADLPRVDFFHWVLFDLPATLRSIDDGAFSKAVTARGKAGPMIAHSPVDGALQGLNGYTDWFAGDRDMAGDYYGYDGPCPPWNDSIVHHYVFTLHALSVDRLIVTGRVTGDVVRAALADHSVATARIVGLYSLDVDVLAPVSLGDGAGGLVIALIVVRHGETDWNRIRRLQGHTDIPLNAAGVRQAARLAAALADEPITAIHSSDLRRAVATAEPISMALGLPITRDALLRERNYGILEGRTFPEILVAFPDEADRLRRRDAEHAMPDGESQHAFHRRVVGAVSALADAETTKAAARHAAGTILLVTHGGVLDMLHRTAFGIALDAERECPIPNAVVNRLTYDRGRFSVVEWAREP